MKLGHLPDTDEHREQDARECPYLPAGAIVGHPILQRVLTIREQPILPNCTGEAIAACVEVLTGEVASGVDLWREGLRREGRVPTLETGLAFVPALVGLTVRGWAPRRDGEWTDVDGACRAPGLEDELAADDQRGRLVRRARIDTGPLMLDAIDDALSRGHGVVFGALVPDDYQTLTIVEGTQVILGPGMLGTRGGAHAQRIAGVVSYSGRRCYLVQNSWGAGWGGAQVDGHGWFPGCVLASEEAILCAYDCHVIARV